MADRHTTPNYSVPTPRTDALMQRLEREAKPYNYRWHDWSDLASSLERELFEERSKNEQKILKAMEFGAQSERRVQSESRATTNAAPQVPGSSASTGADGEGAVSRSSGEPLSQQHPIARPAEAASGTQSAGGLIPQGPCETTQTPRFQIADCACGTYEGNLGPCLTWWQGNGERCVYCEHGLDCHVKLSKMLGTPQSATGAIPGETPRTDAVEKEASFEELTDFARQLERELESWKIVAHAA